MDKSEALAIDIILPVHGRLDLTKQAVDALYAHTKSPFHLIVMDDSDASIKYGAFHAVDPTDTTSLYFEKLCKIKDNITYYNSPYPFKNGNQFFNKGFEFCKHEFVATVMNSLRVEPEWDIVALELMRTRPDVGIIGFKNLFPTGLIESAGIKFVGHMPTDYGRDQPAQRLSSVSEIDAVQWAFALLRLKAVKGVLDESLFEGFVGWDDIDNCFEVKSHGWKILYCGLGAGYHTPRATRGDDRPGAAKMNEKNAITFFKRWGFYEKYLEYRRSQNKLEITNKLSQETKANMSSRLIEFQVLSNLANQHRTILESMGIKAMREAGIDPEKYELEMDPNAGVFKVKERPPVNQVSPVPVEVKNPAGDTKTDEPAMAGKEVVV